MDGCVQVLALLPVLHDGRSLRNIRVGFVVSGSAPSARVGDLWSVPLRIASIQRCILARLTHHCICLADVEERVRWEVKVDYRRFCWGSSV
jgi:hypothetical protein